MHTLRRRSSRRHCFRTAKILLGAWTRDCLGATMTRWSTNLDLEKHKVT